METETNLEFLSVKPIPEYEDYMVYSNGQVYSILKKKFLKSRMTKTGYCRVCLYKNGKQKDFYIHRLVAEAFIPNPDNLATVDHIDNNKQNNCVENLRWMTREENTQRAQSKSIKCLETGIIYPSITEAERQTGISDSCISAVAKGKRRSAGGLHWEYV